jgi:PKD domain
VKVARRLVRSRLAAAMVCVGGVLLAIPGAAFAAAPWESQNETIPQTSGATQLSTGLDQAQDLIAVWNDGSGTGGLGDIKASVRSASSATWQSTPTTLSSTSTASDPDVAVASDGTAVATWVDSGNIWAETRAANGTWAGTATEISSTGSASSPQAAMVGDSPSVYWIDGNDIQFATTTSLVWGAPASVGATIGTGVISDLAVAVFAGSGDGAASWLRDEGAGVVDVDSAQITGSSWGTPTTLSTTASTTTSSVAVAAGASLSALAWNDATGLHVATGSGGSLTADGNADEAGAIQPSVAIDSTGQVFVASISSGAATTEIRDIGGTWATPTTRSSSGQPATPSLVADDSGDVIASWTTSGFALLDAYDVHGPTGVTIVSPGSTLNPGTYSWSVTAFDIWSNAGSTTKWNFSDDGSSPTQSTPVQHTYASPGTYTVDATEVDGAGNPTAAPQVQVTISATAPTNNFKPQITNGSAPVDGTMLGVTPGGWSGDPTPVLSYEWQRCAAGANCQDIASGPSYALTAADVGSRIRVVETATNTAGAPSVSSSETPVVGPIVTTNTAPGLAPSSSIADGSTLTASAPPSLWHGATGLSLNYAFEDCNGGCTVAQTGASPTYVLDAADVGFKVEVIVTATAGPVDGSSATATATSSQTSVVAPISTAVPMLAGNTTDGSTLTASSPDASWDGATGLTKNYTFLRCDGNGNNCSTIVTNTTGQYTLTGDDLGTTIRVTATASKNSSTSVTSDPSNASALVAPTTASAASTPTGTAKDGQVLDGSGVVSWKDYPDSTITNPISLSYQWLQCVSGTCTAIQSQATSAQYTLQASDVGTKVEVRITATAGSASTSVTSPQTSVVAPLNNGVASVNTPTVQQDGQTFGATTGSWDNATNLTFGYQWYRCNTNGGGCSSISGANTSQYIAGAPDVGQTLEVAVSASKGGSAVTPSLNSSQTAVIAPLATGLPTVTGAAQDTSTLSAQSTSTMWDGVSVTPSFQWYRCNTSGGGCSSIGNATNATYKLALADIGSTIEVIASASKNGSALIASSASSPTSVIAPLLTTAPGQPTGNPQDTQVLTAPTGSWADQGGLSFRYQWLNCSPTCVALGAASSSNTYTLQPTDDGDTIKVTVTAFVGAGTASSTSAATLAIAPFNTGVSTITLPSQTQDGQGFTASDGAWDGVSTSGLSLSYVWKRCAADGTGCAAIAGATSKSYTATAADVGSTLKAFVSASAGTSATTPATGDSAPTPVIAPRNTVLPAIAGTPTDGQTLTTTASTSSSWDNPAATLSFGYQWMRCDASGANCTAITGATTTSYVLTSLDVADPADSNHARHTLRVHVTATVNGASTSSDSPATGQIAPQATTLTQLPGVVGQPIQGQLLVASPGQWTGTGLTVVSFQWIRCNASTFQSCINLGTASPSSMTYTVQPADVGSVVTFIETVSNILGVVSSQRAPFSVPAAVNVLGPVDDPVVTASAYVDGTTISTDDGTWSPSDGITFSYQWLRCPTNLDVSTCPGIQGATTSTYTLTPSDVGSYVIARVRADLTTSGIYQGYSTDTSDIEDLPAVTALPAKNTVAPTVSGPAQQGGSLTATSGTWTGTNTPAVPITYAYQWFRCNTSGAACSAIGGATTALYTATVTDVGSTIEVRVIGSNSGGSQQVFSAPTAVVAGLPAVSSGGGGDVNPPATTTTAPDTGSAGGGGHTGTSAGKTDKTPPRLVLAFGAGGKLAGGTTLTVDATCPKTEVSCTAKFQLLATLKKPTGKAIVKPVSIASAKATVKGGQLKVLKLKLSPAARTALKRTHSLKVTLTVSVTDAAGNVAPKQTKGITLRVK